MGASGTPILKGLSLSAGATGTIDFGQIVGYFRVRNGGSFSVFMAIGDTPPTPSVGDGRIEIPPMKAVSGRGVALDKLSFAMAGTNATTLDAVGIPGV